jgi:hypothetical protein
MTTKRIYLYHQVTVQKSENNSDLTSRPLRMPRRAFIESAMIGAAISLMACGEKPSSQSPAPKIHLIDHSVKEVEAARQAGANGVITPLNLQTDPSYIKDFKASARARGLEPGFWIEIGRDPEAASKHTEWLHVPQHTDWLADFPDWSGARAAVFPWLPLNNREVFDYQVTKVASIGSMLEAGDRIYLSNVQNPPAGCGCGNLQCRSWDNSPGEKIAPSPYEHKELFFTSLFIDAVKAKLPRLKIIPVICPECEQGVEMGNVASPDAATGYCHSINCSDPCGSFYYPGLVRALGHLDRVGLLCTYKALRRDLPLYGEAAGWLAANINRYGQHGEVRKLVAVIQGWDVSTDEIKAQLDMVSKANVGGYILSLLPLDNSYWPVAVDR